MAANILLRNCPDRRLRRVARLAKLPLDTDLEIADRLIYAILGPAGIYVGQVGCINDLRAPIKRF